MVVIRPAATWESGGFFGTIDSARVRELREDVKDQVDMFINAYLEANPPKAGG